MEDKNIVLRKYKNPYKEIYENTIGINKSKRVVWVEPDDSYYYFEIPFEEFKELVKEIEKEMENNEQ